MANSIGLVDGNVITASVPVAATAGQVLSSNGTTLAWTTPTTGTVTGLTGEVTTTGSGLLNVTLSNLAVINKTLSGLSVSSGAITSADSILVAMGKIQGQINGLSGGSTYKGTWNATTNTPTIVSGVGTGGDYYIVSTAGTTNIDGTASWDVGDWIIFDGTVWQKVDNTDSVTSVNGFTGAVNLTTTNISEGTNLYYTDTRARAAISLTTTGSSGSSTYISGVLNIPSYTLSGLGGVPTITTLNINGTSFDLSANRSWTVGTVTSVNATVPTGFSVGSPVTSSGNIAITFAPGYSLPTNALQANWDAAYNDKINSVAVTGTTTKTLTLTQQDGGTLTTSWTDINTDAVASVFGRTGAVVAANGDYTTAQVTESGNLYYTDARARSAISLTTTGSSGASTYIGGVFNIPTYTLAGLGGVSTGTTITINGTAFDLSTSRAWSVGTVTSVNATVPTGFSVGSPVTSSGNIGITFAAGYSLPTTASQTNWDSAYTLSLGAALTKVDDTNVTLTLAGSPATSVLRATSLTLGWTGQLAVGRGGTGASTLTGVVIGNGASAMTAVSGTAGQVLRRNSGNTAYEFFTPNFPTGSGTANNLTKWTSSVTIGDSQIIDNGTNVGVGVTPTSKLTVNGSVEVQGSITGLIKTGNTQTLNVGMLNTSSSPVGAYMSFYGNNLSTTDERGGFDFVFNTQNSGSGGFVISRFDGSLVTKYFKISKNGNLILQNGGTFTDDTNRLQVTGNSKLLGNVLVNTATAIAGYGHALQVLGNASGGMIISTDDDSSGIGIVNSASANKTWDISPFGNDLVINESGISPRFKFKAGGNIEAPVLAGTGTRMVVADASGVLSTQAIPSSGITGSGLNGQVTYWTGTSSISGHTGLTYLPNNPLTINTSVSPSSNVSRGINMTSTVNAFVSGQTLIGADINPQYTIPGGIPNVNVDAIGVRVITSFSPAESDFRYTGILVQPTINQSGTANGVTRGIRVNPTFGNAVDWRSIEWNNNSGYGLYGLGSAQNLMNGKLTVSPTVLSANFTNANTIGVLSSQLLNIPTGNRGADGNVYAATVGANYFRFNGATTLFGDSLWSGSANIANIQFDTTGTITMANSATTGYRPLSVMQLQMQGSGSVSGTVDKGATLFIQGVYPSSLTGTITFTDYAAIRINDLKEWGGTTVVLTNRWGIYQAGADDKNYFAASVGIGVVAPTASAKLQVDSTTQGFLPPRMTGAEMNAIGTPAPGLIVFNTTDNKHYGYNGTTWTAFY